MSEDRQNHTHNICPPLKLSSDLISPATIMFTNRFVNKDAQDKEYNADVGQVNKRKEKQLM